MLDDDDQDRENYGGMFFFDDDKDNNEVTTLKVSTIKTMMIWNIRRVFMMGKK